MALLVLEKQFKVVNLLAYKGIGLLLMRLFIGTRLIYGVLDNVFHWERMKEFEAFLGQFHFPFPLLCAVVSVYAQLIAGLMILLGWKIRWAAAVMVFNFVVALVMVHRGQSFEQITAPLAMLAGSLLFLFEGAGPLSVDGRNEALPVVFKAQDNHGNIQQKRERIGDDNGQVFP